MLRMRVALTARRRRRRRRGSKGTLIALGSVAETQRRRRRRQGARTETESELLLDLVAHAHGVASQSAPIRHGSIRSVRVQWIAVEPSTARPHSHPQASLRYSLVVSCASCTTHDSRVLCHVSYLILQLVRLRLYGTLRCGRVVQHPICTAEHIAHDSTANHVRADS